MVVPPRTPNTPPESSTISHKTLNHDQFTTTGGEGMKGSHLILTLLIASICYVLAQDTLDITSVASDFENIISITPQENRNGWVNPEDLPSMPQCVAQQDQSAWLRSLTQCTHKQCTRHFGIICTHHQWLTQLTCLSSAFSEDVVREYISYCSRSVLAKAQLYGWIREITHRTWLVEVGDANGLMDLESSDLVEGYAPAYLTNKAPTCLTTSSSRPSMGDGESFRSVLASCEFTSSTQHTGNAQRPWEYHEDIQSMIPLDTETAGYDLIQSSRTAPGRYFDKACFCGNFGLDLDPEPCFDRIQEPDLTRERMWMNATCGPPSLPANWSVDLRTTESAYIPFGDWTWPSCVDDFPSEILALKEQCAAYACESDANGYCGTISRAVDRTSFCKSIRYDSCGGSCHVFRGRIKYVNWLHDLCGHVEFWNGLPENWTQLAKPTISDLIPFGWSLKRSDRPNSGSGERAASCPTNGRKITTMIFMNGFTFIYTFIVTSLREMRQNPLRRGRVAPRKWIFQGVTIASLYLLINLVTAGFVHRMPGYKHVSVLELFFLWSTMPRLVWPAMFTSIKIFDIPSQRATLLAEYILQFVSAYPMLVTVYYGYVNNLYLGSVIEAPSLVGVRGGVPAMLMYIGAFFWSIIMVLTTLTVVRAIARRWRRATAASNSKPTPHHWTDSCPFADPHSVQVWEVGYGTMDVRVVGVYHPPSGLHIFMSSVLCPLWITQWIIWGGFILLSSEEYCPPQLRTLAIWWCLAPMLGAVIASV